MPPVKTSSRHHGNSALKKQGWIAKDNTGFSLAIQNAANNEHDEDDPANRGIRTKYRFGLFPPTTPDSKKPATDTTQPAP